VPVPVSICSCDEFVDEFVNTIVPVPVSISSLISPPSLFPLLHLFFFPLPYSHPPGDTKREREGEREGERRREKERKGERRRGREGERGAGGEAGGDISHHEGKYHVLRTFLLT
jgi:hypothetical protein